MLSSSNCKVFHPKQYKSKIIASSWPARLPRLPKPAKPARCYNLLFGKVFHPKPSESEITTYIRPARLPPKHALGCQKAGFVSCCLWPPATPATKHKYISLGWQKAALVVLLPLAPSHPPPATGQTNKGFGYQGAGYFRCCLGTTAPPCNRNWCFR